MVQILPRRVLPSLVELNKEKHGRCVHDHNKERKTHNCKQCGRGEPEVSFYIKTPKENTSTADSFATNVMVSTSESIRVRARRRSARISARRQSRDQTVQLTRGIGDLFFETRKRQIEIGIGKTIWILISSRA